MAETEVKIDDPVTQPRFVRKKRLQQELEHITHEMYLRNKDLADINRALSLLRTIDTLVLESHTALDELCKEITSAIALSESYPLVGIFVHRPHLNKLELKGWFADESLKPELPPDTDMSKIYLDTDNPWFNDKAPSTMIYGGQLKATQVAKSLHLSLALGQKIHSASSLKTVYALKLMARRRLVGLMVVGFREPHHAMGKTEQLLERLGQAVGVAVDNRLLFDENQRVVSQLQKSNVKLKQLDEAKDEFISMSSHQLRTPLTSMKGYVSMVLEGDGGKPTAKQRHLLEKAFASSQKMVYLISDLLNVSRLKTGKFVIEPVPSNLVAVVQSEVDQLNETAKSRDLTLVFEKPKKFPTVMLDETKTRQVMMNFIDNAIYYTPAGGHIEVKLEDKPGSIEFSVTDSGIGVPKADQRHLFGKFYRAGNARKARPDGTGLGLFMAKKVIIAQGGAVIFHTKEGVGSTFGFSFPKSKVVYKAPRRPSKTTAQ